MTHSYPVDAIFFHPVFFPYAIYFFIVLKQWSPYGPSPFSPSDLSTLVSGPPIPRDSTPRNESRGAHYPPFCLLCSGCLFNHSHWNRWTTLPLLGWRVLMLAIKQPVRQCLRQRHPPGMDRSGPLLASHGSAEGGSDKYSGLEYSVTKQNSPNQKVRKKWNFWYF